MSFTARFDPDWLDYPASDLHDLLGPYAPWLLDSGSAPIDGLSDPGVLAILLANRICETNDAGEARGLPRASLLPARWVREEEQPRGLPRALIEQSKSVVSVLGAGYEGWKLAPLDASLAQMDMYDFPMGGTSGFAALAAALAVAVGRGRTRPRVFASIGWSGETLQSVGEIDKKLWLLNALAPATVFVHPDDHAEAVAHASPQVTVTSCALPPAGKRFTAVQQIRPLLAKLGVRPTAPGDPLDDCIDAFNQRSEWSSESERRDYYDRNIRERLSERMRETSHVEAERPFLLVYNPTNEPTCRLMLDHARPSRVVVVRQVSANQDTDRKEREGAWALARTTGLSESEVKVESLAPSMTDDALRTLMARLGEFLQGGGYSDAMNGTSFLKSFAVVLSSRYGLVPIALEQGWDRDGMVIGRRPVVQRFGFVVPG